MKRLVAGVVIFWAVNLFGVGLAEAEELPVAPGKDSEYVKEHYPEAYRRIYQAGKTAGETASKAAAPAGQPVAAPQAEQGLGAWWEKNSLTYGSLPERWLFHSEGTLDYKLKKGNTESEVYNGSASLMARKRRFTNTLFYAVDRETSEPTPVAPTDNTDTDYRSFQESLRYDLTAKLYGETGYMWEKDTANLVSSRDIFYAGLGYALLDQGPLHLEIFLGGGSQEEKFPEAIRDSLGITAEQVTAGYFREDFQWKISERITYKETFRIIQNFSDSEVFNDDPANLYQTGETKRYRWFLINEIYFSLTDHLSFMTGYKIEYDSNPWPTVRDRDETLKSGIQFSF